MVLLFSSLFIIAGCQAGSEQRVEHLSQKDSLVMISGGTIDDEVSSILLFTMDNVENLGCIIANTDCIYNYAMQSQWRIQSYISKTSYPIALSDVRAWNPFPWIYRKDSIDVYNSQILQGYPDNTNWPPYPTGETLLQDVLTNAIITNTPVTLLITEPITPLSELLKAHPELEAGIKRVIWMGGAINVPGNLDPTTIPPEIANNRAEWNAFWDPYAIDWIFKNTSFPIIMFPLDVTDQAKLTQEFMSSLQAQSSQYSYSKLIYGLYSLVNGEPYFEMWNTLTTVYVARPDLFETPVAMKLKIETEGYWQGTISESTDGRSVSVVLNIADKNGFYNYVLNQAKRN
jgi:purine nucleosidase